MEALTGSVPEEGVSAMRESKDERELAELLSSFSPSVARAACERVVMLVSVSRGQLRSVCRLWCVTFFLVVVVR